MKERPILMSAPMVRAILADTKTQTRRVVKPASGYSWLDIDAGTMINNGGHKKHISDLRMPYGQPGDRLWVRETFMDLHGTGVEHRDEEGNLQRYAYAANTRPGSYGDECRKDFGLKWRPSSHMPRAASRILLEVTAVRVERLHDISESDAMAEGITTIWPDGPRDDGGPNHYTVDVDHGHLNGPTATTVYRMLWEWINAEGSWDANPWVWVVEFKRVRP